MKYAFTIALITGGSLALSGFALAQTGADGANICAAAVRSARQRDVAAICQHGREWISAFTSGDIDRLMSLYTPDAQVALHGQHKLRGKESIRAFFAPALAARPKVQFLLQVEDIRVHGDVAYLISKYWYTSDSQDGKRYQDAGRSLLIYRRHRSGQRVGAWKIQVDIDQASPDVAFPAPASAR